MSRFRGTDKMSAYSRSLLLLLEEDTLPDFHPLQNVLRLRSIYLYLHHFSSPFCEASDIFRLFLYNIVYLILSFSSSPLECPFYLMV